MTDLFDWDRLARYVSGESGATERADIERWAAASETNRAMLESVRRRWNAAGDGLTWNVDAAWARLAPKLREVNVEPAVIDINSRRARQSTWLRPGTIIPMAAAAALLMAVAFRLTTVDRAPAGATTMALTDAEFRTGIGEQRTLDLADGSQVMLGAATTLRLAAGFGDANREVFLEGQAFLRVRHDAARPFVVNANGTQAIDLGTAFEVRAWPNEGVRVAVTEGIVEVRRNTGSQDSTVLQPGDVADVPASGETVVRRQQNVERLLGWTRGELVFDDTPLSTVARELERWFDVQVRIDAPALADRRISISPRISESIDVILDVIAKTLSVRVERSGNSVTIRSGPPVNPTAAPRAQSGRVEAGA